MKSVTPFAPSAAVFFLIGVALLPQSAAAQPVLSVDPPSLNLTVLAGTNAPARTLLVKNTGKGKLTWAVSEQPAVNWVSPSPQKGVNNGAVTLTFATSGLTVGQQYQTTLQFQSNASNPNVPVPVSVTMVAALTVTCPANKTVTSPDGQSVVVPYSVSTSGGVSPVTVTGSPASGSPFPVGTTSVQVTALSTDGQKASCQFEVNVNPPPSSLTVSCPANVTVPSSDGQPVVVTYTATTSGGLAPVTVTYAPESGSSFAVGTAAVQVTAESSDEQEASCGFSVTVNYSPPPPTPTYGPQLSITCPAGAVDVWPDMLFYQVVLANGPGTTYCLKPGVHYLDRSIIPETGDSFIGEYGAILEGTWTSSDDTQAAFRAHLDDIDDVTIKNLVIRNLRRGIHAYAWHSDRWTIEFNEIRDNHSGIVFPADSRVRNNYIHHNHHMGYQAIYAHDSIVENNEIANNGWEQKIMESSNVIFRNNFLHHNEGSAIWYDSNNTGAVIEGNLVEDNGHIGIWFEISATGTIRNNIIRRSRDAAIFLSTSRDSEIYNNTLENNFRGITYFINCPSIGGTGIGFDLRNNLAHDNTIVVDDQIGALTSVFSYAGCTPPQLAPYLNGQKNLRFIQNAYDVPLPLSGKYWYWNNVKFWNEWQALGHDTTGTAQ